QHSRKLLPPSLREYVGFLHSRRSDCSKVEELERFQTGKRQVLWVTEIGGMGLDIPDVAFVGQLGAPSSLTVWIQRAGRAGRMASIQARAVLFLEASALKEIRTKTAEVESESEIEDSHEGQEKTYRKKLEPSLREYVETRRCRRKVVDKLFDNPPARSVLHAMCCDNCTPASSSLQSPAVSDAQPDRSDETVIAVKTEANADTPAGRRIQQHLHEVREALLSWRRCTALRDFPHACFTSAVLLPDPILSAFASKRSLTTIDDLSTSLPCHWAFAERYSADVLAIVKKLDAEHDVKRMADK
ncbi:P-loop containing nucleoside triphosphate hydrolase protein, partial [Imleria badia]